MNKLYITTTILFSIFLLFATSLFTVDQRQICVIFQLGEAVRVIDKPGLNIKIPLIQNIQFLDKRILNVTAEEKELTASDEKRVIVDAFAKYKIVNPIKFIKTVNNYSGANLRLNKLLESSMRTVIGRVPLNALLSEQRSELMVQICNLVHQESGAFGIEIIDVRILKSDLPQVMLSILGCKQKERKKQNKLELKEMRNQ